MGGCEQRGRSSGFRYRRTRVEGESREEAVKVLSPLGCGGRGSLADPRPPASQVSFPGQNRQDLEHWRQGQRGPGFLCASRPPFFFVSGGLSSLRSVPGPALSSLHPPPGQHRPLRGVSLSTKRKQSQREAGGDTVTPSRGPGARRGISSLWCCCQGPPFWSVWL